jgi:hypothetical protein
MDRTAVVVTVLGTDLAVEVTAAVDLGETLQKTKTKRDL